MSSIHTPHPSSPPGVKDLEAPGLRAPRLTQSPTAAYSSYCGFWFWPINVPEKRLVGVQRWTPLLWASQDHMAEMMSTSSDTFCHIGFIHPSWFPCAMSHRNWAVDIFTLWIWLIRQFNFLLFFFSLWQGHWYCNCCSWSIISPDETLAQRLTHALCKSGFVNHSKHKPCSSSWMVSVGGDQDFWNTTVLPIHSLLCDDIFWKSWRYHGWTCSFEMLVIHSKDLLHLHLLTKLHVDW